jgi:transposase InsO family protein
LLGFEVSERSVSRYLIRLRCSDGARQLWRTFLRNHRDAIATLDFFTVPTASFRLLYGLFVIEHGRRRILHFNVTAHPTSEWIMQQLREAFPDSPPYRYVIMDRDSKFNGEVIELLKATGLKPVRTSVRSPWQNGVAERWVGSCRRELLDHVIIFNEEHLRRLVRSYLSYYHEDRTHLGLQKETPGRRPAQQKPSPHAEIDALPRVGGLHHRYVWREAA